MLRIVEQRAAQLLAPEDAQPIIESVQEIRRLTYVDKDEDDLWPLVEAHATKVKNRIVSASPLIGLSEGGLLDAAITLGHIEHNVELCLKGDQIRRVGRLVP